MRIPINTFWRSEPLSGDENALLEALFKAHSEAVTRENISSVLAANAALGSGRYSNGISAAVSSIGGIHAPIEDTIDAIQFAMNGGGGARRYVVSKLSLGEKVPGWGNSFFKGEVEPGWEGVRELTAKIDARIITAIDGVTQALHDAGKLLFPNPSAYTAAAAIIIGIPIKVSALLFITARISGWTQIIHQQLK